MDGKISSPVSSRFRYSFQPRNLAISSNPGVNISTFTKRSGRSNRHVDDQMTFFFDHFLTVDVPEHDLDNFWNIRKSVNFPPFSPFPMKKSIFFFIATNIFQWWIFPWHLRFARCLDRRRLGLRNFRSGSKLKVHVCSVWTFSGWWFGTWLLWLSIYWECHHPNWRTHIFQRGRYTTNQFWYILSFCSDPNFETCACCGLICRRELAQQLDFLKRLVWCGRCPQIGRTMLYLRYRYPNIDLEVSPKLWSTATSIHVLYFCPDNAWFWCSYPTGRPCSCSLVYNPIQLHVDISTITPS